MQSDTKVKCNFLKNICVEYCEGGLDNIIIDNGSQHNVMIGKYLYSSHVIIYCNENIDHPHIFMLG